MVDGLRQLRETIKTTDERIRETCRQFPEYGYLLTIPGFGPDVSAKVIGALGNPFRFQNRKQVLKMAGLDLGAYRSGKTSEAATPVISKKGKADLRYALYQAASSPLPAIDLGSNITPINCRDGPKNPGSEPNGTSSYRPSS
jgi:transposase